MDRGGFYPLDPFHVLRRNLELPRLGEPGGLGRSGHYHHPDHMVLLRRVSSPPPHEMVERKEAAFVCRRRSGRDLCHELPAGNRSLGGADFTMVTLSKKIFKTLCRVDLTVVLLLLLAADLGWGYLCLSGHAGIFRPLNKTGLISWATTYGVTHIGVTGWFFLMLILLTLLCLNTLCCTTEKVVLLLGTPSLVKRRGLFLTKLSPHIMHYALVVMLAGYMVSYHFPQSFSHKILLPQRATPLPQSSHILTLTELTFRYYEEGRMISMTDRVIHVDARLRIQDGTRTVVKDISLNSPIRLGALTIHMDGFSPMRKRTMSGTPYIEITARKDPGVYFYFTGMLLFTAGLILYAAQWLPPLSRGMKRHGVKSGELSKTTAHLKRDVFPGNEPSRCEARGTFKNNRTPPAGRVHGG